MDYNKIYNEFMVSYRTGEISPEAIGEVVMKLAHCFADANHEMVSAERRLDQVARINVSGTDDNGKSISSAKADILTAATNESHEYNLSRCKLQNIEFYVNALKTLQKGVLNEYSHMNN